jgi:hypothetical protein
VVTRRKKSFQEYIIWMQEERKPHNISAENGNLGEVNSKRILKRVKSGYGGLKCIEAATIYFYLKAYLKMYSKGKDKAKGKSEFVPVLF